MIEIVPVKRGITLKDYERYNALSGAVQELRAVAGSIAPKLKGRRIWMVNSTAKGGGVAEMMPRKVSIMRQLGLDVRWAVMNTDKKSFFGLTKRIHNLMHGLGDPGLGAPDSRVYNAVNRECARSFLPHLSPDDLLVIHDPQPAGMARYLKKEINLPMLWRCHIGLAERVPQTASAWNFMRPYLEAYDRAVFSVPSYVPSYLADRTAIIYPAIDPLDHKNRDLEFHKLISILYSAGLIPGAEPAPAPMFANPAKHLYQDGTYAPVGAGIEPQLLYRPVITQISRWDNLKGWFSLLEGFAQLKTQSDKLANGNPHFRRTVRMARLILAGPEPGAVQDDPEQGEVLAELRARYLNLPPALRADVGILLIPMNSIKQNALVINSLQRLSTVVAQNSIQEGFGLTATEAMWKVRPVMVGNAVGLRQQVRDGVDGRVVQDSSDPMAVAQALDDLLRRPKQREVWAYSAQKRVFEHFLIFTHVRRWIQQLQQLAERPV